MTAPSKRRPFSPYLSLPIVVALVCLLVAKLVAMQRADFIAQLSDRIAHAETRDASAAVRELAEMAHPPAEQLVAAVVGPDREVAAQATQSITKWLGRAQRQIERSRSAKSVAKQLLELAAALDARRDEIAAVDARWLLDITQRILELADHVPSRHVPLLTLHCDSILSQLVNGQDATGTVRAASMPPAPLDTFGTVASPQSVKQQESTGQLTPGEHAAVESLDSVWRQQWSQPVYQSAPSKSLTPITPPVEPNQISPLPPATVSPSDADEPLPSRPLADVDTRALLERCLTTQGIERSPIEHELRTRGFLALPQSYVEAVVSPRPADRLQFIDEVLASPSTDVRPWLMLLADDADAEVRLAAVTLMATTNDPSLIEKAWQTAIHDRDPRIASLAGRLRERRASTQRR